MKSLHIVLATVVVVGYFGFEIYNLHRLQYRMEPDYIFDQFAAADVAESLCGPVDPQQLRNFRRNFAHVTRRAVGELADTLATDAPQSAEQLIETRLAQRTRETEAIVASEGCDGTNVKRLLKFHEIRARLNLR